MQTRTKKVWRLVSVSKTKCISFKFHSYNRIELTITFECNWDDLRWSEPINNIDIKDRMISFKTPIFPYPCDLPHPVDVILKQNNHVLATLKYYYFSTRNIIDDLENFQ